MVDKKFMQGNPKTQGTSLTELRLIPGRMAYVVFVFGNRVAWIKGVPNPEIGNEGGELRWTRIGQRGPHLPARLLVGELPLQPPSNNKENYGESIFYFCGR